MTHDKSIIEVRDEFNHTLLHYAAGYNRTSCIRVLLRFASHHLDVGDEGNETPLMYADNRDAVKMLLRAGADVRQKVVSQFKSERTIHLVVSRWIRP